MTYNEAAVKANILAQIPLKLKENSLGSSTGVEVILMNQEYQGIVKDFKEKMQEILKTLKKEGFDDRALKMEEAAAIADKKKAAEEWKEGDTDKDGNAIEKPECPTDEELAKLEEAEDMRADFEEERKELEKMYVEAMQKKAAEEVEVKRAYFGEKELEDIYKMLVPADEVEFRPGENVPPVKVSGVQLVAYIASELVK